MTTITPGELRECADYLNHDRPKHAATLRSAADRIDRLEAAVTAALAENEMLEGCLRSIDDGTHKGSLRGFVRETLAKLPNDAETLANRPLTVDLMYGNHTSRCFPSIAEALGWINSAPLDAMERVEMATIKKGSDYENIHDKYGEPHPVYRAKVKARLEELAQKPLRTALGGGE